MPVDREPVAQGAADFFAHAFDGGELLDRGGAQGVHRQELLCERSGRRGADVADGQGDEDAREGLALGLVQLGEHLLGALGGAGLNGLKNGLSAQLAGLVGLRPEVANLLPVPGFLALLLDGLPHHDVAQILGAQVEERSLRAQGGCLRGRQEFLGAGDLLAVGQLAAALESEDGAVLQRDAVAGDQGGRHLITVVFGLGHGERRLVAEALHVQGASGADMGEAFGDLRGAQSLVRAAQVDVAFLLLDECRPAGGALGRHDEGTLGSVAHVLDGGDDLGDDVAGLAQDDEVADEDALAGDFLRVVQGCARDVRARDQHGFHDAVRGHAAGAAHLDADVEQARVDLFGRELVGGRPARRARGRAEGTLQVQVVDLDDDAVDLVDEAVAVRPDLGDPLFDGLPAREHAGVGRDGQAPVAQLLVPAHLSGRLGEVLPSLDEADAVGDHGEGALGGLGRVFLAQGAGGGVARVDEGLFPGLDPCLVECGEVGDREVDLAAHLDARGDGAGQGLRNRLDRPGVSGHVLADVAVASGRGAHETAVLVEEVDGQAVNLDLGRHLEVGNSGGLGHAGLPPGELLEGEHVVEGHHLGEVAHLGETGVDAAAHAHRGRVGTAQLRVSLLDLLDLAVHAVVVRVREGRRITVVVGGAGLVNAVNEVVVAVAGRLERGVSHGVHSCIRGGWRTGGRGAWAAEVAIATRACEVVIHRGMQAPRVIHRASVAA